MTNRQKDTFWRAYYELRRELRELQDADARGEYDPQQLNAALRSITWEMTKVLEALFS